VLVARCRRQLSALGPPKSAEQRKAARIVHCLYSQIRWSIHQRTDCRIVSLRYIAMRDAKIGHHFLRRVAWGKGIVEKTNRSAHNGHSGPKSSPKAQGKVRYAVVGLGHVAQVAVLPAFVHKAAATTVDLVKSKKR